MTILDRERSLVVVIDLQGKLLDLAWRSELVVAASKRLLQVAELFEVPVVLTEQYPRGLGPTRADVKEVFDGLASPKRLLEKASFGCCGDPAFEALLSELRPDVEPARRQVVVAGIEAHVCVVQTVLGLLRSGSEVHLCWEAVSCRDEEYRRHALDRMTQAGAVLTNHESVGFEWCRDKDDPRFRAFSGLLKGGMLTG